MYRKSFPKCNVKGSIQPKKYRAMVSSGAIPEKCVSCQYQFEASCTRAIDKVSDYQVLDYGFCGIDGPTDPVEQKSQNNDVTYFVPRKCSDCKNLHFDSIREFVCGLDTEIWGDFYRSLDWGNWEPKYLPVGIEQKIFATDEIQDLILQGKEAKAVKELRRLYPPLKLESALECIKIFKGKINS